eukprot:TRINITY_DN7261_c0_g1_i1.p1 TRINITY_DN7261_c0_g1~~TRINITY_DN7261_c0_g1_i1.p1  ORF type:complete len:133 (+),score=27.92 TRINITY_DN7261_c0_g1_i1:549-947(+)
MMQSRVVFMLMVINFLLLLASVSSQETEALINIRTRAPPSLPKQNMSRSGLLQGRKTMVMSISSSEPSGGSDRPPSSPSPSSATPKEVPENKPKVAAPLVQRRSTTPKAKRISSASVHEDYSAPKTHPPKNN